ncbi:MAG: histidine kinase [Ferruginibacter sp.]
MRIAFLLLSACIAFFNTTAQKNVEDSLEKEIAGHPAEDTIRINLLQTLCKKTYNTARALSAAEEIISIAKKLNLPDKEGRGYMFRGTAYLDEGKDSLYLADLERAGITFGRIGDKRGSAIVLRARGRYFENNSAYNRAIENYSKAAAKMEEIKATDLLKYVNSDIGNCYYKMGNYNKAIEFHLKSQKGAEEANDLQTQAISINNIALVNKAIKKYATAIEQYKKAQQVYIAAKDSAGYAAALQGIGIVYDLQDKSDSAMDCYHKALDINLRNGFKLNAAENYSNIGVVYKDEGQYSRAYYYISKAIETFRELNRTANVKQAEINIGELICSAPDSFFVANNIPAAKKYDQAVSLFKAIIAYAEESEDLRLQAKGWEGLSVAYEKKGDYKSGYAALDKKQQLQDSLVNEEQIEETTKQADNFEFEKREAVTLAKHDLEIKQEQTIKRSITIGAAIILLGAFASFMFYKRKRDAVTRQREAEFKTEVTNTEMKALRSQMNPHFIFNSLNSIGDYIAKNNVQEADRYLGKFAKLMRMILENSEQKDVPLSSDLKALELYMQLEALRMNQKFTYEIKVDDDIDKDATLVPPLILQPFVENSIWHGIAQKEGKGKILICIKKENDDMINCVVEDDGVGRKQNAAAKVVIPGSDKTSLGMKITQARIDILNKTKNSNAAVKLSDLEQGVRVEVKLPLAMSF